MSSLAKEIKKRHPFEYPEEEAYLNLWRTFTQIFQATEEHLKVYNLCATHYNILRILAGEKLHTGEGLPVLEVRDRLITRVPDITRLTDKLVNMGLIKRTRTSTDRRLVLLTLTPKGEKLTADLHGPAIAACKEQLGHLTREELQTLSRLLEKARAPTE
jgi:DNA-binding MarR family transcriptional regulator